MKSAAGNKPTHIVKGNIFDRLGLLCVGSQRAENQGGDPVRHP